MKVVGMNALGCERTLRILGQSLPTVASIAFQICRSGGILACWVTASNGSYIRCSGVGSYYLPDSMDELNLF